MNFLRHNVAEKLMAAALALLIFWSVQRTHVAEGQRTIAKKLEYQNLPRGTKVVESPPRITITAKGDPEVVQQIEGEMSAADVSVRLDNARRGTAAYAVQLSLPPRLLDAVKWSVSPSTVQLTVAGETDLNVRVIPVPIKPLPKGFKMESWVCEPDMVLVAGDDRKIGRVAGARVAFDPTAMVTAGELKDILLVDKYGRAIEDEFTVSPRRVRIVPSSAAPVSRLLPVTPQWRGKLPAGYRISAFRVTPAQIDVEGVSVILDSYNELSTMPIDLTGIDRDRTVTISLEAPEGVRIRGADAVQVRIEVEQFPR